MTMTLVDTWAEILDPWPDDPNVKPRADGKPRVGSYRFYARVEVNGKERVLEREAGTQNAFYEPWTFEGVTVWFDACREIFDLVTDDHGGSDLGARARFAAQQADRSIAPEPLHPWCPLPKGRVAIEDCYTGQNSNLGPMNGHTAHSGLDINHPAGTPIWAPVSFDTHGFYNSLAMGNNNNRHRGLHRWPDGSDWLLGVCHMTHLTVPEGAPVEKGSQYASGAGVLNGAAEHSHFYFHLRDIHGQFKLDPWIVFWQILRDGAGTFRTPDRLGPAVHGRNNHPGTKNEPS
jgi:hypothetical protein